MNITEHNLLLVEDEPISRRALKKLLASSGYEVTATKSGEDALLTLENNEEVEAAVVDLELPGMNGAELIRQMEKGRPNVCTVLISAQSRESLRALGVSDNFPFLQKPIEFAKLLDLLAHYPKRA